MTKTLSAVEFARKVVADLRAANHTAYFAGGCVRDQLLGRAPRDYDVATSARPAEVRHLFGYRRTIAVGESFGVITVLGPKPQQVEVATFRSDGAYSDGRHPDEVRFSSPVEDAARRDFTINGMFYDPLQSQVIDFVGGQEDLQAKLIRAIGNPLERIAEDRLRMLRAIRFAATYAFHIEQGTLEAIQRQHRHIDSVSQERITYELQRMLCHRNRARALTLLGAAQLLSHVLPEITTVAQNESRWQRLIKIVDALESPDLAVVLSALFGLEGAALAGQRVTNACRRLKLSNELRKSTEWIVKHQRSLQNADALDFSVLQPLLISGDIKSALLLLDGIARVDGGSRSSIDCCRERLRMPSEQLDPEPFIRGDDLQQLGVTPGPRFAELLSFVRSAQLNGKIDTKSAAIELVRRRLRGS